MQFDLNAVNRDVTLGISLHWDTLVFGFLYDMPMDTTNNEYANILLVMGNWEKNVFYNESNSNNTFKYLYYSTKHGVVEYSLGDGVVWKLENIFWDKQ